MINFLKKKEEINNHTFTSLCSIAGDKVYILSIGCCPEPQKVLPEYYILNKKLMKITSSYQLIDFQVKGRT
jgi:hypothetical protein